VYPALKKLGQTIQRLYRNELFRWMFSLACALALVALAATLSTLTYYDNDDLNIAWALAGYRTGTPSFAHPFINCIMAIITSALYTVLPNIPWWLALQLAASVLGMTAVFASILKIGAKHHVPLILALVLMAVCGAGLFYYGLVLVTFTLSAAAAGAGAVALILAIDADDEKRVQRRYGIGAIILLAISLLVRNSSGIAAACFAGGALLVRLLESILLKDSIVRKRMLSFLIAAVLTTGVLVGINAYGRTAQNPEGFTAYDEARSAYMDYPHDSYNENPEIYTAVGWDDTLANLASVWFYMDERITTDNFLAITENSAFQNMNVAERLQLGVNSFETFFQTFQLAVYFGVFICAAYAAAIVLFLFNRKRWLPFVGASAFLIGTLALLAVLLYFGRINLRVWMTISIFSSVSIWLCALCGYDEAQDDQKKMRLKGALRVVLLLLVLVISLGAGYKVFRTVVSYEDGTPDMLARSSAVTAYAQAHPDNVYIRDVYVANNVDALSVYRDNPPVNLIDWGGCDMNTVTRVQQLAVNGLSSTWAKDLFREENVYYIGDTDQTYLELLTEYMNSHCGANGYEIVDQITENIVVVQFVFGGSR